MTTQHLEEVIISRARGKQTSPRRDSIRLVNLNTIVTVSGVHCTYEYYTSV